jgi:predicted HNH restriction endonuclease
MSRETRSYADRREVNKASVIKRRKQNKLLLVEYKGGKCERCGYAKCVEALEFHHLDPTTKEAKNLGTTAAIEKQKAEADKCILVCANCHREIHRELRIGM